MVKTISPSCERNKSPILEQLQVRFAAVKQVLEIGSGNGQHAVFFAKQLPHLIWHTSDVPDNHAAIQAWLDEAQLPNIEPPRALTIGQDAWPEIEIDAVFTANTTHIMQPIEAQQMMQLVSKHLPTNGIFCQYGPMKIDGNFTSDSNREFDHQLRARGFGGIRDVAQLQTWAEPLTLIEQVPMPANNFLLVWRA